MVLRSNCTESIIAYDKHNTIIFRLDSWQGVVPLAPKHSPTTIMIMATCTSEMLSWCNQHDIVWFRGLGGRRKFWSNIFLYIYIYNFYSLSRKVGTCNFKWKVLCRRPPPTRYRNATSLLLYHTSTSGIDSLLHPVRRLRNGYMRR